MNPAGAADDAVAIVGSGPAAIAAAWQLCARGLRPVMLDAGDTPPPQTVELVRRLRESHGSWGADLLALATHNPTGAGGALPKKLVFGSDYFHGHDRAHSPLANSSFIAPTFARGGYTVAWGGAMLPMQVVDMAAWPEAARDLHGATAEVLSRLPVSASPDGLDVAFPAAWPGQASVRLTGQAQQVLSRIASCCPGVVAGQARLAVQASRCRYCGLCLSGCPFDVILGMDACLAGLLAHSRVDYRPGVVVSRLADHAGGVAVHSVDHSGRALPLQVFRKVFLAAGAINSARIALESGGLYEHDISMLDSQKFAVPLLVPAPQTEAGDAINTLPALFVELLDGEPAHWIHLQVSAFSHHARKAMEDKLSFGPLRLSPLAQPLTRRLMVGWGGLHSDLSDGFHLRLLRAHRHGRPVLKLQPQTTGAGRRQAKQAMRKLARALRPAGIHLLSPGAVIGPPGAGFHFGGSLPMRASPQGPLEADTLGRLGLWRNVHVVDSSVFPTIPATTMVLTIMANAWRIAASADL